jgi:hypothetical protein
LAVGAVAERYSRFLALPVTLAFEAAPAAAGRAVPLHPAIDEDGA